MIITYKSKHTEKLCTDYKEMKRFFSSELLSNKLAILMTHLKHIDHLQEFVLNPLFKKYRYHELSGDKRGIKSLSIDYSYRMTLTLEVIANQDGEDTIKILEVSNHYGE